MSAPVPKLKDGAMDQLSFLLSWAKLTFVRMQRDKKRQSSEKKRSFLLLYPYLLVVGVEGLDRVHARLLDRAVAKL